MKVAPSRWWMLAIGYAVVFVGYYFVMHLRSVGWVAGNIVTPERFPGYWAWIADNVMSPELLTAGRDSTVGMVQGVCFLALLAIKAALYVLLLARTERPGAAPGLPALLVLTAVISVPLLFAPHLLSTDVYSYTSYARLWTVYGENPYLAPPSAYPDDLAYTWNYWKQETMVYGPVWLYASAAVSALVEATEVSAGSYVMSFKLLAAGLHLVNGALVWLIVSSWRPGHARAATAMYLLNPLLLIEFAGNAHNDALLITLLLCGVALHRRSRPYLAIAAFTLAGMTKLYALPIAGLYGIALLREQPSWAAAARVFVRGAAVGALVCVAVYLPVWQGLASLAPLSDSSGNQRLLNSAAAWVHARLLGGDPAALGAVKLVFRLAFLAVFCWLLARTRRAEEAIEALPWYVVAFCVLGATWFWPWYASAAVALAAVTACPRARCAAVWLSLLAPLLYATFVLGTPPADARVFVLLHEHRALVTFAPVVAIALSGVWTARRRARAPWGAPSMPCASPRPAG